MKIGVLGTGMVGHALASRLVQLGHQVRMGAREATNEKAAAWVKQAGTGASQGTFVDAAGFGDVAFHATVGQAAVELLSPCAAALRGKVLIDVSNPLDFSKGMPPTLFISGADSLGERIQRALPDTRVVKALNTVNANVMVNPGVVKGDHDLFVSGNDPAAKKQVSELLVGFGWKPAQIVDLGDITTARGTEAYLMLWIRLWGAVGSPNFNIKVVR